MELWDARVDAQSRLTRTDLSLLPGGASAAGYQRALGSGAEDARTQGGTKRSPNGTAGTTLRPLPGRNPVQASSTIPFRKTPIPLISTSARSPGFMKMGGLRVKPTPPIVPLAIRSPGFSGSHSET